MVNNPIRVKNKKDGSFGTVVGFSPANERCLPLRGGIIYDVVSLSATGKSMPVEETDGSNLLQIRETTYEIEKIERMLDK